MKKIILCTLCLTLFLTACGTQQPESTTAATEAAKTAQEYLDEENAILDAHNALWETVFASMSKNVTEEVLSTNYGDVLMAAVENVKEQLADADYEALKADAEKIRQIEEAISALPQEELTFDTQESISSFPAFTGKDLDGNDVDSSLFAENTFTVVNFWYSGCKPCVEEMAELEALSQRVREQGGELIAVNTETLDGNADAIATAKEILEAKGVTFRNIYFDSASEAGQFAGSIMAFPTTYVIDRNGNVVGAPLLGSINSDSSMAQLQQTIDQAIANS